MIGYRRAMWSLAVILCFPVLADATGPSGGPLQTMQQQIDRLTRQYEDLANRLTRPQISYALSCAGAFSLTIRFSASANKDIAYFAVQEQGGNPPANFVTFVEPGVTTLTHDIGVEPGPGLRTFLLVAADTDGNVAKAVLPVAPDVCFPCPGGASCP